MTKQRIRTDVILTDADQDIIDFIQDRNIPRATLFKTAMRYYMNRKEEEKFDDRVKRLLNDVLEERGEVSVKVEKVASKKRLPFGHKKV